MIISLSLLPHAVALQSCVSEEAGQRRKRVDTPWPPPQRWNTHGDHADHVSAEQLTPLMAICTVAGAVVSVVPLASSTAVTIGSLARLAAKGDTPLVAGVVTVVKSADVADTLDSEGSERRTSGGEEGHMCVCV